MSVAPEGKDADRKFSTVRSEVLRSANGTTIQDRDVDARLGIADVIAYKFENALVAKPAIKYYMLMLVTLVIMLILGWCWTFAVDKSTERAVTSEYIDAIFLVFNVFATGGYVADMADEGERVVYCAIIFSGLIVFAVLVGFITDSVSAFIENMTEGRTKVAASGHTLILGWNQSTVRVVCQIAFLRRQFMQQNETCSRRLFPWLRTTASTPVACNPVVVVTDKHEKVWMDEQLNAGLLSRGISPSRTQIGWDVVCRSGDPCDIHDLIRVNAQSACSIVVMMTEDDAEENAESNGKLHNASSLRCLMALRHVLYTDATNSGWVTNGHRRRIVVQTSTIAEYFGDIFYAPDDSQVVLPLDLSIFVNTLMFKCASKPGLSYVLLSLLNFEDEAIRCRRAEDLAAGENGENGALIGLTVADAILQTNWDHGVMIGVTPAEPDHFDPQCHGIMADPEYKLKASDLVIFLSRTSMPKIAQTSGLLNCLKPGKDAAGPPPKLRSRAQSDKQKILVCGWREKWSAEPKRLRDRIKDLGTACAPQTAEITFVNMFDESGQEFVEEMVKVRECAKCECTTMCVGDVCERGGPVPVDWNDSTQGFKWDGNATRGEEMFSATIKFVHGDAANHNDMKEIMAKQTFDVAVVLGTQVQASLPAKLQDSRVLTICMLLRHLSPTDSKMRVVSENSDDQTALLAVAPKSNQQDFINTQAIIARALTMNLAYPRLNMAINQLFKSEDFGKYCTPEIDLLDVADIPQLDGQSCAFLEVQLAVRRSSSSESIVAFGYFKSGEAMHMVVAPPMDVVRTWGAGDKIIVFQRQMRDKRNFALIDKDNDGMISREEWISCFGGDEGFDEFDASGDSMISTEEFMQTKAKIEQNRALRAVQHSQVDDIEQAVGIQKCCPPLTNRKVEVDEIEARSLEMAIQEASS